MGFFWTGEISMVKKRKGSVPLERLAKKLKKDSVAASPPDPKTREQPEGE